MSETVTACQVVCAYEPYQLVGYETGNWADGCYYGKCHNGYACYVVNNYCTKGHDHTGTFANGWPSCPHGHYKNNVNYWHAHCRGDNGWDVPGYRAP